MVCFPKAIHAFSQWEAEQIVLSGRTFVVLISVDVGCLAQQFAIFLLFPLFFFIPSTAHNVLTPSSFTIYFSSLPIPLLQVSQLENNCCKVGLFVVVFLIIIITILILWPGAFSSRGIFHHEGKDITFTVKKKKPIYDVFSPLLPELRAAASEERREQQCQRCFWRSRVHPSPLSSPALSHLREFKKKKQKVLPYKLQTPAAEQWKGI